MGYVLCMITHLECMCELVRANRTNMCAFAYLWTDSLQIKWEHTTGHRKLHVNSLILVRIYSEIGGHTLQVIYNIII
jgi:hypothetical protein